MRGPAAALAAELRRSRMRQPEVAVYSPLLGRYYSQHDILSECVARHLTERVRFADAVRALSLAGVEAFIQCGPLSGLARAVDETLTILRLEGGGRVEERGPAPRFVGPRVDPTVEDEESIHEAALA